MFDKIFGGKQKEVVAIDSELLSPEGQDLQKGLLSKVVGQDKAIEKIVRLVQTFRTGIKAPYKPLGCLMFLGPTGTGKTRIVEALAEHLFSNKQALIRIDCSEFKHDHETAKLIGAPPGYLG